MAHSILDEAEIPHLTQGEGIQDLFGVGRLGTGFSILTGPVHILVERSSEAVVRELLDGLEEDAAAHTFAEGDTQDEADERDREPEV
jgi:hypothetical protein